MTEKFYYISATKHEIESRKPDFFQQFPIFLPAELGIRQILDDLSLSQEVSEHLLHNQHMWQAHLEQCKQALQKLQIEVRYEDELDDVSRLFIYSFIDEFLLRQVPEAEPLFSEKKEQKPFDVNIAPNSLIKKKTSTDHSDSVDYYISQHGEIPLLVITSLGISLAPWSHFIQDKTHPFKLIFWQSGNRDLLQGTMGVIESFAGCSEELNAILSEEGLTQVDVLSWCSGSRIIYDFVARFPDKVKSLILLSPTFRSAPGCEQHTSKFEDNLQTFLEIVTDTPAIAPQVCQMLQSNNNSQFEWSKILSSSEQRKQILQELLSMPVEAHKSCLTQPFVEPESLVNYANLISLINQQDIKQLVAENDVPTHIIMGSHDTSVNNTATDIVFADKPVSRYSIFGASHYLHSQQYTYFLYLMEQIIVPKDSGKVFSRLSASQ